MKHFLLTPLFVAALFAAELPTKSPFNVRNFGATGDGTTKDTAAFQKALDTCAVHGGNGPSSKVR